MVEIECGLRKKSFWLCSNPGKIPELRRQCPIRIRRPPRLPCTRRRVPGGALCGPDAPGSERRRRKTHAGPQPRRRPPFPFVSSSSSSLVSCGFPRLFRCFLRPGVRFPAPPLRAALRGPSIGFKTGKSCSPELAFRRRLHGVLSVQSGSTAFAFRPARFGSGPRSRAFALRPVRFGSGPRSRAFALRPVRFGSGPRSRAFALRPGQVRKRLMPPAEVPGSPPGSGLLFRSFAVRSVHGLHLAVRVSVLSVQACLARRSLLVSVRSLVRFRSFQFALSSGFRFVSCSF